MDRLGPHTLLLLALAASCSSVSYRPEVAEVAELVDEQRLQENLEGIIRLGPRRAGDPVRGELTVQYLEARLAEFGVSTSREEFTLPAASLLTIQLDSTRTGGIDSLAAPGVYFGRNISQPRVLVGVAEELGVSDIVTGFSLGWTDAVDVEQISVFATIPGTRHPERVLEISAHHDTVPATVGADDNTSGVVVLLEVARILQAHPPACTVRLCFFAAEEIGLEGSAEHLSRLRASGELEAVIGLINLDSVGHFTDEPHSQHTPMRVPFLVWPPSTGNFLAIIGDGGSADLARIVEGSGDRYAPDLPLYSLTRFVASMPDMRRSDHAHYWDAGIPAVLLSDSGEFRGDHYHRPADSIEIIDLPALRQVAILTVAAAIEVTDRAAND